MPRNYKGMHLTTQNSKVCEEAILKNIRHHFDGSPCQLASSTLGWGHRHALLYNIMQWLLWLKTVVRSVSTATMCQEPSSKSAKCVCSVNIQKCIEQFLENCLSESKAVVVATKKNPRHSISPMLSFKEKYLPRNLHTLYAPTSSHICFPPYKFALNTSRHYLLRKVKKHHSINMPFLCVLLLINYYKTLCFHHASTKMLQTFFPDLPPTATEI